MQWFKIHTWHREASSAVILHPFPYPVLNRFIIDDIIPCAGSTPLSCGATGIEVPLHKLTHEEGDVVLVWGATFPKMMRFRFPIGTWHKPTWQKHVNLSSYGNSAAEVHSKNFHNLCSSQLIIWRNSAEEFHSKISASVMHCGVSIV